MKMFCRSCAIVLSILSQSAVSFPRQWGHIPSEAPGATATSAVTAMATNGPCFARNRGQVIDNLGNTRPDVVFTCNTNPGRVFFREHGISYVFIHEAGEAISSYRIDMEFLGAQAGCTPDGVGLRPDYENYYLGHCPNGVTFVPCYDRVEYQNVYPNIDIIFSTLRGRMKYDILVKPGGHVEDVRLRFGAGALPELLGNGNLRVTTPAGVVEDEAPLTYQAGKLLPSAFRLSGSTLSFHVSSYDPSAKLVIDPWSTFYGGGGADVGADVIYDGSDNVIYAGESTSINFPVSPGAFQTTNAGSTDAIILKFSAVGTRQWCTYYGGALTDRAQAIDVNSSLELAFSGRTGSVDFPVTPGCYQAVNGGSYDSYYVRLNSAGTRLYATYFGGDANENTFGPADIAYDASGNIFINGDTESTNFPVLNAYQPSWAGGKDGFIAKFNSSDVLQWSTYYGTSDDDFFDGLDTDPSGNIIAAATSGSFFTDTRLLIVKFNSAGTVRAWQKIVNGMKWDFAGGLAVDASGNTYVTGFTWSPNFPTTAGAFQTSFGGGDYDAFVLKIDPTSVTLWSTFLGGGGPNEGEGIAVNSAGNVFVVGHTQNGFPTAGTNIFQATNAGSSWDGFVSKFSSSGAIIFSTYFGGDGIDNLSGVTTDGLDQVWFTGSTGSINPPLSINPYQSTLQGTTDMLLSSFVPSGSNVPVELVSFRAQRSGERIDMAWQTATEGNNRGFEIERSFDHGDFAGIAFVFGHGTSNVPSHYSYIDRLGSDALRHRSVSYRLKQIDRDGACRYSGEIAVSLEAPEQGTTTLKNFPNPFAQTTSISFSIPTAETIHMAVFDASGREVALLMNDEKFERGQYSVQFNGASLPPGMYTCQFSTGDRSIKQSMVISR
jgi:hypothetical protein